MPQILSNFILRSKSPNFERDYFKTKNEMNSVPDSWMDEGHISYCEETGKHYVFKSITKIDEITGQTINVVIGEDRWHELDLYNLAIMLENHPFNFITVETTNDLNLSLSSNLKFGAIVYVKENGTYYSNYYNNELEKEFSFKPIARIDKDSVEDKFDKIVYEDELNETLKDYAKLTDIVKGEITEEYLTEHYVTKQEFKEYQDRISETIVNLSNRIAALESTSESTSPEPDVNQ